MTEQRTVPTVRGRGGLPMIALHADDGGAAEVYLHGAQVTSWRTPDGRERLYLSERAAFDGRAAIRGGVPVIFPQFAGEGALPKHGFARTRMWECVEALPTGRSPYVVLQLAADEVTRAIWPHQFVARVRVELGDGALRLSLSVHNPGERAFDFTAALHTYLRLEDAFAARVLGLQGLSFRDSAGAGRTAVQHEAELAVVDEVNRIYFDVPGIVGVRDAMGEIRSVMHGFRDVVIWNPGRAGEGALADLEPGGAAHMLCVEAAAIGTPVHVPPGGSWSGSQRLTAG